MSQDVFAYGTLQFPEIFTAVTGLRTGWREARLDGWSRHRVRGEAFPAITPAAEASVPGVLWYDVPAAARERLDVFEGPLYVRRMLEVTLADGACRPALCYVIRPRCRAWLAPEGWDAEAFRRRHRERYVQRCRRLRQAMRHGRDGSEFA